ncbi:hypothetical protein RM545_08165 [Zunongwangia sp. F260]|uniref:Outer membrane protein beta-barrel domain-containing protein n=1 Tax=Autumnicola lenta TaxID=3075593 RepID=A0ABU3CK98_9FLAO|nr:hypothetical protein [Zunongwangia sp. F260]MDT0646662.1 hypothetical protein [Zunongwangia sp. F260]
MKFKNAFIYLIILLFSYQVNAQNKETTHKLELSIKPQFSTFFVPYKHFSSKRDPDFEIGGSSRIYGLEISTSVVLKSIIGVGAGIGSETLHLENSQIDYSPIFFELTPLPSENPKEGFATFSGRIGTHLGKVDKNGVYLRVDLGYYVPLFNHFSLFFKGIYTYQSLYKSFSGSNRPSNKYLIQGIGFGIGIEYF